MFSLYRRDRVASELRVYSSPKTSVHVVQKGSFPLAGGGVSATLVVSTVVEITGSAGGCSSDFVSKRTARPPFLLPGTGLKVPPVVCLSLHVRALVVGNVLPGIELVLNMKAFGSKRILGRATGRVAGHFAVT